MTSFEKALSFLTILTIVILGCTLLNYLIKYFFIALGWGFRNPAEAIIITIITGIIISFVPRETFNK